MLDLKKAIRRTEPADALVRAPVVIIADPEFDAFPRRLKTLELRALQELLPNARPEALDLAQCHGMMRPRFDMRDAVLAHLRFEAAHPAPARVLAPIIGEHLLGRLILAGRDAIDLDRGLRRGAAEKIRSDEEARVIIEERDEIGITSAEPKGEDIGLPHLIGCGSLKETRPGEIAPGLDALPVHQPSFVQ